MERKIIIAACELPRGRGRRRFPSKLRHHALESYPYFGRSRRRRSEGAAGARRALPIVLASDLFLRLPAWSFRGGRPGPHPGFFPDDARGELAPACRSYAGTFSFAP